MDWLEIFIRLGSAALIGGAIGLNRDLHHKASGLRTLSLVCLGAALATLSVGQNTADASRVIQGLITGIGFLGAGVIVHEAGDSKVRGLTTAATIWVTALLGAACGLGAWRSVAAAISIIAAILLMGGRIERAVHTALDGDGAKPDHHSDA